MPGRFKDVRWLDGTDGRLDLDECQDWPARQSDPLCPRIYMTAGRRWVLDAGGSYLERTPEQAGDLLLNWGWHLPSELIIVWNEAKSAASAPSEQLPLPPVVV